MNITIRLINGTEITKPEADFDLNNFHMHLPCRKLRHFRSNYEAMINKKIKSSKRIREIFFREGLFLDLYLNSSYEAERERLLELYKKLIAEGFAYEDLVV